MFGCARTASKRILVGFLVLVAGRPSDLRASDRLSRIHGGKEVPSCGWPTSVSVGTCTGTLVHPELVVYAGHCGDDVKTVTFGETRPAASLSASVDFCETHPQTDERFGRDFAFCRLREPVGGIPVVPILMGCEVDAVLRPGKSVTIVGFGNSDRGGGNIKRQATVALNYIRSDEANVGGDGVGCCEGDSGGPIFVQLTDEDDLPGATDNSWRVFGIISYYLVECGTGTYASMMHVGIEWLETRSGLDLTPCHDADGTWNPGPECGGFPINPNAGNGAWPTCAGGEVSGPSATCAAPANDELPTVSLKLHGATASGSSTFYVDASSRVADVQAEVIVDAGATAIASVSLLVEGEAVQQRPGGILPYAFTLSLALGSHTVGATATDEAGNQGRAETVQVQVEEPRGERNEPRAESTGCRAAGNVAWVVVLAMGMGLAALGGPPRRP